MKQLTSFWGRLNTEPAVLVYCFTINIYGAVVPNLLEQKVCSPDSEPAFDFVCNNSRSLTEATDITTLRSTIREVLPASVLLLAGSWRDATGLNKPMMYLALIGEIVGVAIELFAAWQWVLSPWITSAVDAALYGLSGGSKLFYVGATCVITDQSSSDDRTARLALYQATATTGACLATGLSGFCLRYFGYKWFFIMVILLHVFTVYLVIWIKEDKRLIKDGQCQVFNKLKSILKSRPNNYVVWMMLLSCCILNVCSSAEDNLNLYFLQQGFGFSVTEVGVYSAFRQMTGALSSTALQPVFTKLLQWSDLSMGIAGSSMMVVTGIMMAFARNVLELITIAMLEFMRLLVFTVPMSIVTKCVHSDEIGVFVSLRFIGECIFPIVIFYVYERIFSSTVQTMPGAYLLASAGVSLLVLVIFSISYAVYKSPSNDGSFEMSEKADKEKEKYQKESKENDKRGRNVMETQP